MPRRVVLAKLGLDGHDRGIQVVARALRDAGWEVIYTGLWQTPEAVARAVDEEDAQAVGVSILSGAHRTLVSQLICELRSRGLDRVRVVVGGIIPDDDLPQLLAQGVAQVFTPGASLTRIAEYFETL